MATTTKMNQYATSPRVRVRDVSSRLAFFFFFVSSAGGAASTASSPDSFLMRASNPTRSSRVTMSLRTPVATKKPKSPMTTAFIRFGTAPATSLSTVSRGAVTAVIPR